MDYKRLTFVPGGVNMQENPHIRFSDIKDLAEV